MMTNLLCFLVIFGSHLLLCCTKPVVDWNTSSAEHTGPDNVHGRIIAVNMAHLRKKRQTAENSSLDDISNRSLGKKAFHGIQEANKANISKFFEGDIVLDPELEEEIRHGANSRNGLRSRKRLWTSRIIPYRIPSWMSHITSNVQQAIKEFHSKTCLRFVPYHWAYHKNYITFSNSNGCSSRIGKRYAEPGKQTISIADGCNWVGTIMHEMMHAIGFFHEQARSDRDKYVKIYWQNILDGFSDQFDKYSWVTIDDLGVSYDYQSVMHYDRMAFTKNGKPTIVAIGNENMDFGTSEGRFSARDVVKINALYDCKTKSYGWTSWSGWTPCDDDCYRSRQRYCYHSGNMQSCGGNVNAYGVETDKQKCPSSICPAPIDGNWGRWSGWGSCSKTCNDGVRRRVHKCNNPPPGHNGKPCPGSEYDSKMCILKRCNLDEDDVDFENSRLGMWKNSYIDNLNWKFNSGHTQTIDTGPNRDHTSGSGHYLYVESSYTKPGERADLVSPWITAKTGGQCLKLYYTMYGKTMGTLAIKLEQSNGVSWLIFYEKGNKGMGWKKGSGNINVDVGFRYQLTIQGTIGQRGYSDIAIDDVYIDDGLCKCQDDYHTCHIWAAKGECTANKVWMKRHCKKSCKVCQGDNSNCEDNSKHKVHCPGWAKNGECQKNPGFMKVNCRKSCNTCGVTLPNPSCQDNSKHKAQCPAYAYHGECQKNTVFMKVNCPASCGVCVPVCKDSHRSCPGWAKLGECSKNPTYMKVKCKLSCKQCLGM